MMLIIFLFFIPGEEKFSYGYDSQGKLFNAGEIQDLDEATFEKGDVLGTFLVSFLLVLRNILHITYY